MNATLKKGLYIGFALIYIFLVVAMAKGFIPRHAYDIIMMWINFGVLVFVIVKFGKEPLVGFLNTKKDEMAGEIQALEDEKSNAEAKNKETLAMMAAGEAHIKSIQEKIIAQGKKEKERIIEEAKAQSRYMLEEAKQRVGSQIIQARRRFRSELVDAAIKMAMERLPKEITQEDNQILLENYLASTK